MSILYKHYLVKPFKTLVFKSISLHYFTTLKMFRRGVLLKLSN